MAISLKDRLNRYWKEQKNKSTRAKAGDILFIVLIILLIIPGTRREIRTFVTKIIMTQPSIPENKQYTKLDETDLQWQLKTYNGDVFSLDDLSGNVIFLNFWATWCPPCRAEMPAIQKLYNQFQDDVVFVLVSNESRKTVEDYFAEKGYELPVYYTQSEVPLKLRSKTIPATYIISKTGEIVLNKRGAAKWDGEKNQTNAL